MAVKKQSSPKIHVTKDYRLFQRSDDNRPVDSGQHAALLRSMRKYGFLSSFPVSCYRNGSKKLVVKDGQHRLLFAEMLDLPVYYVEESVDFDIADVNCTQKTWQIRDFAMKHANNGLAPYQIGIDFAEANQLPLGIAFALLSGANNFSNIRNAFQEGRFQVTDPHYAYSVAQVYCPIVALAPRMKNSSFLKACMAVCRVEEFDGERLVDNATRCRHKLVAYSTRDAYLTLVEEIYNFNRHNTLPLKHLAVTTMKARNPVASRNGKKD